MIQAVGITTILAFSLTGAAAAAIMEGKWSMSITTDKCLTNDDPVPSANEDEDCESTHAIDGNTVTFEKTCPDSHSTGEITYRNEKMQGTIQSTGKDGDTTIEINGEYVGPCE